MICFEILELSLRQILNLNRILIKEMVLVYMYYA